MSGYSIRGDKLVADIGSTITGSIHLQEDHRVKCFQDVLTVENGYVDLRDSRVERLPWMFKISGALYLNGCERIIEMPELLHVGEELNMRGAYGVTALPEKLKVGGDLDLRMSDVTALPEGAEIDGIVFVDNVEGFYVPASAKIGGLA
jgi:hypothetical protein